MPLTGAFTWVDKRDQVKVSIPLKGVAPSIVDILGKQLNGFLIALLTLLQVTTSTLKVTESSAI
jgi:carbohydrate-binding DOMON domain-containing protein